jgi:hypothetical protein
MNDKLRVLLLVICACGGGGGTSSLDVNVEDPSAFCRAAAETGCTTMYECLTQAERDAKHLPATEAECERKLESSCEAAVDDCTDATHGYAAQAAGMCLDEMNAATCNDAGEPWLDASACANVCATTAGSFRIAWAFSPSWHSCSELGVSSVAVYSIDAANRTYVDVFDCYAASGMTDALPVGTYSVRIALYDASNKQLWSSAAIASKLDDDVVDLGTITIPVTQ